MNNGIYMTVKEEEPIHIIAEQIAVEKAISPTVSIEPTENGALITFHDINGDHTIELQNDISGGSDGFSPTLSVTTITGGHRLSITDVNGTQTVDIMDGTDGQDGSDGADGANGSSGECVDVTVTGATPVITAEHNHRYLCGEVSSISFTPSATGICEVLFTSGTTAAILTLPSTVKMPAWFDTTALDTETIYDISIADGIYGAVMSWAAT